MEINGYTRAIIPDAIENGLKEPSCCVCVRLMHTYTGIGFKCCKWAAKLMNNDCVADSRKYSMPLSLGFSSHTRVTHRHTFSVRHSWQVAIKSTRWNSATGNDSNVVWRQAIASCGHSKHYQHNFKHLKYSMNWLKSDCDDRSIEKRSTPIQQNQQSHIGLLFFALNSVSPSIHFMNFIWMNKSCGRVLFFSLIHQVIDNVKFGQIATEIFVYFLSACGGNRWIPRIESQQIDSFCKSNCGLGFKCDKTIEINL